MQLVFQQRLAEGLPHFALALGGVLPALKPNPFHDGVDLGYDSLDDDVRVFALHLVEQLGECRQPLILLFLGGDLLLGFHGVFGDFEDGFEELQTVQQSLLVLLADLLQALAEFRELRIPGVLPQTGG